MKNLKKRKGFTLPEVMMALVISGIVFSAMGVLLSRCFSLWVDAQAHWKLTQHARMTRTRLLYGGSGVGSGILSSTNISVGYISGWRTISFEPVAGGGKYTLYGSPGTSLQNIWIGNGGNWVWAQEMGASDIAHSAKVLADDFTASISNQTINISYTLNFSAMGKTFQHPQTIRAHLINE